MGITKRQQERALRSLVRMTHDYNRAIEHLLEVSHGVRCKWCGSTNYIRFGHYQGAQRYMCKDCGRKFGGKATLPHMQTPLTQVGAALSTYYGGMSLRATQQHIQQQYGNTPSDSTIYRWLTRFSKVAIKEADSYVPKVGDTWIADETMLKIGGQKVWLWDIIDAKTRFLLATKLSLRRTTNDAFILMQRAANRAGGKIPRVVITDALASYLDGIEWSFGSDTKHIQSKPFTVENNTNLIERFHGTLKDRTRVMRGLKYLDTTQLMVDGWLVHYNFFRPHESLGDKTPAEAACITYKYKDWLDVVRQQHTIVPVPEPVSSRPWVRSHAVPFPHKPRLTTRKHRPRARQPRRMIARPQKPVVPELGEIRLGKQKKRKTKR